MTLTENDRPHPESLSMKIQRREQAADISKVVFTGRTFCGMLRGEIQAEPAKLAASVVVE